MTNASHLEAPSFDWAVSFPIAAANVLRSLRGKSGMRVLVIGQHVWCRDITPAIYPELFSIAGAEQFRIESKRLIPLHHQVPVGDLPVGDWTLIGDWIQCILPPAALEPRDFSKVPVRLLRSNDPKLAAFLQCRLSDWKAWVLQASAIRLRPLRFVCNGGGDVLVAGNPLPSIAGEYWYESNRIAVPNGWTWDPPLSPEVLWEVVCAATEDHPDLVLIHSDGRNEFVATSDWCPATYASVRATEKELSRG